MSQHLSKKETSLAYLIIQTEIYHNSRFPRDDQVNVPNVGCRRWCKRGGRLFLVFI